MADRVMVELALHAQLWCVWIEGGKTIGTYETEAQARVAAAAVQECDRD